MTSGQVIGYKMLQTAAITAITSTRIYQGLVPSSVTTYPQINFFMVSSPNIDGNAERERWQINCRATTPEAARELGRLVRDCFNEYQGTQSTFDIQMCRYDDARTIFEPSGIYNHSLDIFIFYIRT